MADTGGTDGRWAAAVKTAAEREAKWTEEARKRLVGRKVVAVEYLSQREAEEMGWPERALVITLDDGTRFYPMADEEGNGPGVLAGATKSGHEILLPAL